MELTHYGPANCQIEIGELASATTTEEQLYRARHFHWQMHFRHGQPQNKEIADLHANAAGAIDKNLTSRGCRPGNASWKLADFFREAVPAWGHKTRRDLQTMSRNEILKYAVRDLGLRESKAIWSVKKHEMVDFLTEGITIPGYRGNEPMFASQRSETQAQATTPDLQPEDEEPTAPRHDVPTEIDGQPVHAKFGEILMKLKAGIPVLMVGPAGCGKTFLAEQLAKYLKLQFTFNSMSAGVSESSLLGRMLPQADSTWAYKPAPFVETYANGGLHLFDEVDAADPNLMVVINAAIANTHLSVPFAGTEPFRKSDETYLIAAANTYGNGADRQYVGRNQLDAATVDRFTMGTVEVDYDEQIETKLVGKIIEERGQRDWLLGWAWGVRAKIASHRMRRIMSTRSLLSAAKLLAAGATRQEVINTYFAGWTDDELNHVKD